jgi:hypothetical protein
MDDPCKILDAYQIEIVRRMLKACQAEASAEADRRGYKLHPRLDADYHDRLLIE